MTRWHVQINEGPTQIITTRASLYDLAVMVALAQLEYKPHDEYQVVKIWVPELLPDYGPYFYARDGHNIGRPDDDRKW